jgi:hypothetical protein
MDLQVLLNQIRDFYINHFREVIKEKRRVPNTKLILEPALRQPDGKVARQGQLNLPIRTDVVIRSSSAKDSVAVETDKSLDFDPVMVDWTPTLKVHVGPFRWEDCRIQVDGLAGRADWLPLNDWYEKWFDEFDMKAPLKKDLQEVVHRLAEPQAKDGATLLTVDFGTAPIVAFEEFLDKLEQLGATGIEVGEVHAATPAA